MPTTWTCSAGLPGGYDPTTDLFAIIERANLYGGLYRNTVITNACNCARTHAVTGGTSWDTAAKHCEWVRLARNYAEYSPPKWAECIDALKHQGTHGASSATASGSDWPCDFSSASTTGDDPALHLFAIIDKANTFAPGPTAVNVIDRACECAKHEKEQAGTTWAKVQDHVDFVVAARTAASGSNPQWSACIDALEHEGGGGDDDDDDGDDEILIVTAEIVHDFMRWFRDAERMRRIQERLPRKGPKPPKPFKGKGKGKGKKDK